MGIVYLRAGYQEAASLDKERTDSHNMTDARTPELSEFTEWTANSAQDASS